jgi:CHAD domain-containing protein
MAYRLQRSESVIQGVKRIAREQLERALADIKDENLDRHEAVHQVRKRFKKIRGLIRLVRPAFEKTYQRENARLRDAARNLSAVRDAQSLIEGFDRLVSSLPDDANGKKPFAGIRSHLVERRTQIAGEQADVSQELESLMKDINAALERVEEWELKARGFEAIAGGFEKTYERAQRAMAVAALDKASAEDFHEWRKRVKYHWYHCRLLENLWKPLMRARRDEAKHLAELLGEDHDAALLDQLLEQYTGDFPDESEVLAFREVIAKAQKRIRKEAFFVGQRMFAGKARHLSGQLGSWWSAWRDAA